MDSNIELDHNCILKSVDDLYEEMFADDRILKSTKNLFDTQNDRTTDPYLVDNPPSFITLKNLDYAQDLKPEQAISSFLNEQIEQIERRDSFDNETPGNLLTKTPCIKKSNVVRIPMSKISDNPHIEMISPNFDIPYNKTIQDDQFQSLDDRMKNGGSHKSQLSSDECNVANSRKIFEEGQETVSENGNSQKNRTGALSLDEVVKTILTGVQHLTDMEFNISNSIGEGKEFIKIEVKIPRRSLLKRDASEIQNNIDKMKKKPKIDKTVHSKRICSRIERMPSKAFKMTENFFVNKPITQIQLEPQKLAKTKLSYEESEYTEPCKVCGGISSKFMHYGGRSCPSCRAFFRRTVEKHHMKPWIQNGCSCKEKCADKNEILCSSDGGRRKMCKFCRFQKCQVYAGMDTRWVMIQTPRRNSQ